MKAPDQIEKIDKFCRKYRAKITQGHERQYLPPDFTTVYFDWNKNNDPVYEQFKYKVVPTVNINMTEESLLALIEHNEWRTGEGYDQYSPKSMQAEHIVRQHDRECRIRNDNASVKAAYEKYLNLLKLVDSYYE